MKQPNILYIMPDELRQRALGYRQEDPVQTPNLDALARESLELENVFSSYPVCTPHRGMLFTGQYPCSAGVMGNANSATRQFHIRLPRERVCLSDALHAGGYHCGYIGKWHLDSPDPAHAPYLEPPREDGKTWDAFTPESRRHHFEFWFSYGCRDQHFTPHYWDNTNRVEEVTPYEGRWSVEIEAERVQDYLRNANGERDPDKPFFLMWSPNPPHMPFAEVPEKFKAIYADMDPADLLNAPSFTEVSEAAPELPEHMRAEFAANRALAHSEVRDYFACITGVDHYIGEVLACLDDCGLSDDTLVIFTSDHGDLMGSHGLVRKGPWYDESTRVPFLMRWPGKLDHGQRLVHVNTPDLMPTLLTLAGLAQEIPPTVEGQDLSAYILDAAKDRDLSTLSAFDSRPGAIAYYINAGMETRGVRTKDWALVAFRSPSDEERLILYDLASDPHQFKDVASSHPDVVQTMRGLLQAWLEASNDWWLR